MTTRRKRGSRQIGRKRTKKVAGQIGLRPVPGQPPTGRLPLTAAQEAVLTRLNARIKANPIEVPTWAPPMPSPGGVAAPPTGGTATPASGPTRDKSAFLPLIESPPPYRLMPVCSVLEGWASVRSVQGQPVENWGLLDSNDSGGGRIAPEAVIFPENVYDLAASVRFAEQQGRTVRAYGSLFSFSDAAFPLTGPATPLVPPAVFPVPATSGFSIDTRSLKSSLQHLLPGILVSQFGPDHHFLVEAGIKLADLNTLLDKQVPPLGLRTLGGSTGQSLAGAISTGTHGSDFDRPPLADSVVALYLIGAGGIHHWIEGSSPLTSPSKLTAIFPCLKTENIHYDDDLLHAVQVSFGSMGVIYAALLNVVPQYTLVQVTRYDTWERLIGSKSRGGAGSDLSDAISGAWSGLAAYLDLIYPVATNQRTATFLNARALQVVVNPIKNDDGSHKCYVSNRAEVPPPYRGSYGTPPGDLASMNLNDVLGSVLSDPHCGLGEKCALAGFQGMESGRPNTTVGMIQIMKDFVWFCEHNGYAWAARDVVDFLLTNALPEARKINDPYSPLGYTFEGDVYADVSHNVMANGIYVGEFPIQSFASAEAFFDLPNGISFIKNLLKEFDASVDGGAYPAGYISLRLCGRSLATLGQQRTSPTACIETALLVTDNAPYFIKRANQIALTNGGFLHWGQNNGSLYATNVAGTFGAPTIQAWRAIQQQLGGASFTNWFMKRLGLA